MTQAQAQTSIYTVPCKSLEIVFVRASLWRVSCPGDASLARVATLSWDRDSRHWELCLANAVDELPVAARKWGADSDSWPCAYAIPEWLERAVLAQVGAWALLAAAHLRDREAALRTLAGDLARQVRADRDAFVECSSVDGRFASDEDAQIADEYNRLLRRAEVALDDPALAPGREQEGEAAKARTRRASR